MSSVYPILLSLITLSGLGVHGQTERSEQCQNPSIRNVEKLSPYKDYYNWGEEVTLQCNPGHYPSSDKIRCMRLGGRSFWRPSAVCIEVKVTIVEVTSSSIRLSIVCTPEQCRNDWTSYISSCILQKDFYTECKYGSGEKIFSNLELFTQYDIVFSQRSDQSSVTVEKLYIKTAETDLTVRNSTESSIMTSDVTSIHGIIIPIFLVKLLILVVLIMVQWIVMDRKSLDTDLDKNEESKRNSILYRTRGAEYVNVDPQEPNILPSMSPLVKSMNCEFIQE
ncbi:uncharacterized protein LOC130312489 [Hyla sarda]|uniref:uncharacterized protein LOC130312489 n=1 Tax=Hyla sarda TaxID=327740 RepID=UPI0024C46B2B|nr:uncharacterized protein LOC130312489 [Hyla sarda]